MKEQTLNSERIDSFAPAHFDLSVCPSMSFDSRRLRSRAGVQHPIRTSEKNIDFAAKASCSILVNMSSVVSQDPEILGGEPVFTGTRVPVKSLFDHLEAGDSIEQFLEGFPSVKREQVIALLEEAREHALSAS